MLAGYVSGTRTNRVGFSFMVASLKEGTPVVFIFLIVDFAVNWPKMFKISFRYYR